MSLAQTLQQSGVVESIARELNIDEQTARTATGALLPAIVAGMGRSSTAGGGSADPLGGLGGLAGAVLGGSAGGLGGGLLDAVLGSKPTPVQSGNDILGSIFGSKDVSRSVAGEVAHVTGLDESLLKRMLPILAMAVMGYLAKQGQQGSSSGSGAGGLGGILGTIASGLGRR
ncbi:hypothetical protein CP97_11085 [Aurantiacibacter atlanticus]|uniref:DUF937 domain-containing protein n=1 Tax=Aurantiacibacter atlanticus TaxID=1648404 RepID=A0A0H4VHT3_9SPHN|nr:DUF937 domain-containing protein [Aurantiacibacter atlanticus]AKQ42456.1 hypothetical protein CP97_11085 [Aurantiacibacter atlanticus]MDF1834688.1 DUF937 domain-containing protein [Alteraurantiacibacter sp. bin_em_oilr2.035]